MALMDFIKKQFIDIIEWTEEGDDLLAWRFPMADMEIQNGGVLVVRESQMAMFVNEGKVADVTVFDPAAVIDHATFTEPMLPSDGIRFVFVKQRLLFLLMIVASIFTLGSTAFVYLLPVIGDRLLHVGAVALGGLWSALGIGILATTVWLIWKPQQTVCTRVWMIAVAAAIAGGAVPGLLMSESVWLAAGLIIAIGATSGLIKDEGNAWDIGWASVFLASDEARWITGQTLLVDAGISVTIPGGGIATLPPQRL